MGRNKQETTITQYKQSFQQYYTLQYEYRHHARLRTSHRSVYLKLKKLEAKITKLKSSPFIPTSLRDFIPNEARLSIFRQSSTEEELLIEDVEEETPRSFASRQHAHVLYNEPRALAQDVDPREIENEQRESAQDIEEIESENNPRALAQSIDPRENEHEQRELEHNIEER